MIESITAWKNEKIFPLKNQYIELTNLLYNCKKEEKYDEKQIKQKINKILDRMNQYEVSIDSLINELIVYNQENKDFEHQELIRYYYLDAYRTMTPINLIDGNTLKFGNEELQSFINELSDMYAKKNKKVYVISIIGAQSSAKSTLINFLFRCSFETSAGRCTKGVYMSVCEI